MKALLVFSAAATMVAACATTEAFSYLNGFRWNKTELNTYDARIISVDGVTRLQNEDLRVEPGVREIVLEAPPAAGFYHGEQRALVLEVEPCMQYWFEAKRTNPLSQDWEPRVNYSARIAGCRTETN